MSVISLTLSHPENICKMVFKHTVCDGCNVCLLSQSLSLSSTALGALGCCRVARHTIELQVALGYLVSLLIDSFPLLYHCIFE